MRVRVWGRGYGSGSINRELKHRGTRRRFSTRRKILGRRLVPHHVHLKLDHFCSFHHEIQDVTLNSGQLNSPEDSANFSRAIFRRVSKLPEARKCRSVKVEGQKLFPDQILGKDYYFTVEYEKSRPSNITTDDFAISSLNSPEDPTKHARDSESSLAPTWTSANVGIRSKLRAT